MEWNPTKMCCNQDVICRACSNINCGRRSEVLPRRVVIRTRCVERVQRAPCGRKGQIRPGRAWSGTGCSQDGEGSLCSADTPPPSYAGIAATKPIQDLKEWASVWVSEWAWKSEQVSVQVSERATVCMCMHAQCVCVRVCMHMYMCECVHAGVPAWEICVYIYILILCVFLISFLLASLWSVWCTEELMHGELHFGCNLLCSAKHFTLTANEQE